MGRQRRLKRSQLACYTVILTAFTKTIKADLPTHVTLPATVGEWTFKLYPMSVERNDISNLNHGSDGNKWAPPSLISTCGSSTPNSNVNNMKLLSIFHEQRHEPGHTPGHTNQSHEVQSFASTGSVRSYDEFLGTIFRTNIARSSILSSPHLPSNKNHEKRMSDPGNFLKGERGGDRRMIQEAEDAIQKFSLTLSPAAAARNRRRGSAESAEAVDRANWRALPVLNQRGETVGRWTMVYDEGFELILGHDDNLVMTAITKYDLDWAQPRCQRHVDDAQGFETFSDCYITDPNRLLFGWYRLKMAPNSAVLTGCFDARKGAASGKPSASSAPVNHPELMKKKLFASDLLQRLYNELKPSLLEEEVRTKLEHFVNVDAPSSNAKRGDAIDGHLTATPTNLTASSDRAISGSGRATGEEGLDQHVLPRKGDAHEWLSERLWTPATTRWGRSQPQNSFDAPGLIGFMNSGPGLTSHGLDSNADGDDLEKCKKGLVFPPPKLRDVPPNFSWGDPFVAPEKMTAADSESIVNQGRCGSCYAIASAYVLQKRQEIAHERAGHAKGSGRGGHGTLDFTPLVACSFMNQGCNGGFPYLVGRWATVFGVPSKSCLSGGLGLSGEKRGDACPVVKGRQLMEGAMRNDADAKDLFASLTSFNSLSFASSSTSLPYADERAVVDAGVGAGVDADGDHCNATGSDAPRSDSGIETERKIDRDLAEGISLFDSSFDSFAVKSMIHDVDNDGDNDGDNKGDDENVLSLSRTQGDGSGKSEGCQRVRARRFGYVGGCYGCVTEVAMRRELFLHGPIVAAIDAPPSLLLYSGGIFNDLPSQQHASCSALEAEHQLSGWQATNHAIVLVGFGEEEVAVGDHGPRRVPFWIARNSWGASWGQDGYFKILRGVNLAGIENQAVFMDV